MAPRGGKTLHCVVVDVSPSCHADLPVVAQAVTELFHKLIMLEKPTAVQAALVLSGSNATDNELNLENPDQFMHQKVVLELGPVTKEHVETASALAQSGGTQSCEMLDALSVGHDLLLKGQQAVSGSGKATLRLHYITDLLSDHCSLEDENDASFLESLCDALQATDVVLEIHILPRPTASPAQAARRASALTALRQLCAAVSHATLTVDAACGANMLHAPAAAAVTPTTVARCMLDLGPWLSVPVWLFKAVTEAKAPSFKLHSDLDADPNAAEAPTHTIIRTTVLKLVSDLGGDMVPPQDVMAAFRYGRDLVPVITAERERMKFEPRIGGIGTNAHETFEKGLQLVGFTDRQHVPRHLYTETPDVVLPVPPKTHPAGVWKSGGADEATAQRSALALSALARALAESQSVAVVRTRFRKGSDLRLAILSPKLTPQGEYLVLNFLPFAEDLRTFQFAPLPPSSAMTPSPEAEAAADRLVASMRFDAQPDAPEGSFAATGDSRCVLNPMLRRFYEAIKSRALDPESPLTPWDAQLLPVAVGGAEALQAAQALAAAAPTRSREPRSRGQEGRSAAPSSSVAPSLTEAGSKRLREEPAAASSYDSACIGDESPAADFLAALARLGSDDCDAVLGVMALLCQVLYGLVDFFGPERWAAVLDALAALRGACVGRQLPATYNRVLDVLFDKCAGVTGGGIWARLKQEGLLGPITSDQVPPGTGALSPEEAQAFMGRDAAANPEAGDTLPVAEDEEVLGGEDEEFGGMD